MAVKEAVLDWFTDAAICIAEFFVCLSLMISSEHRTQREMDDRANEVLIKIAKGEIKPEDAQQAAYWALY